MHPLNWVENSLGDKEIIPAEYFFTQVVPPSFISHKASSDDTTLWAGYLLILLGMKDYFGTRGINLCGKTNGHFGGEPMIRRKKKTENNHIFRGIVRYAFRVKLTKEELRNMWLQIFWQYPLHTSVEKIILTALKLPRFYPEWHVGQKEMDSYVVASRLVFYFGLDPRQKDAQLDRPWSITQENGRKSAKYAQGSLFQAKFNHFMKDWLTWKTKNFLILSKNFLTFPLPSHLTSAFNFPLDWKIRLEKNITCRNFRNEENSINETYPYYD